MIFAHILVDVNESNSYILACEGTREALLVDVADFTPEIEAFLADNDLKLTTIFITHDHYDHTGGLADAVSRTGAEALAGSSRAGGVKCRKVGHGDSVQIGQMTGTVLSTPGHTPEGVSLAFHGLVYTGDALFSGSVGGTTNDVDAQTEIDHLREHILSLPGDTEVHTGHGPSTTVAVERDHNPFFE